MVTLEQRAHGHPSGPHGDIESYSIERSPCESGCSAFFVVARSALGLGSAPSTVETARGCQSLRRGEHLQFCRGPGCGRFAGKRCLREQATAFPALTQADKSCEATAFPALSQMDKSEARLSHRISFLARTGTLYKDTGGAGTHRTDTHTTGNPSITPELYCTVTVPVPTVCPVCPGSPRCLNRCLP